MGGSQEVPALVEGGAHAAVFSSDNNTISLHERHHGKRGRLRDGAVAADGPVPADAEEGAHAADPVAGDADAAAEEGDDVCAKSVLISSAAQWVSRVHPCGATPAAFEVRLPRTHLVHKVMLKSDWFRKRPKEVEVEAFDDEKQAWVSLENGTFPKSGKICGDGVTSFGDQPCRYPAFSYSFRNLTAVAAASRLRVVVKSSHCTGNWFVFNPRDALSVFGSACDVSISPAPPPLLPPAPPPSLPPTILSWQLKAVDANCGRFRGQIKQLSPYPSTIHECAELTYADGSCGDTFEIGPDGRCLCGAAGTKNEHCENGSAMQGAKVYVVEPEDTDVATTVQTAASAIGDAASELRQRRAARAAEAFVVASRSSSSSSTKNAVMLSELQLS